MTEHDSAIEWTHTPGTKGDTWEVVLGCTPKDAECSSCYAAELIGRRLGRNPTAKRYHGLAVIDEHSDRARWTGEVVVQRDAFDLPLRKTKRSTFFVCSRSDILHESLGLDVAAEVLSIAYRAAERHGHRFVFLTKRSERLAELVHAVMRTAPHERQRRAVAFGVSCGSARTLPKLHDLRIADVRRIALPIVSFEPLIEPLHAPLAVAELAQAAGVAWAIPGGESGKHARPCRINGIGGLLPITSALVDARIPVFVKQLGALPLVIDADGREVPLRLRHKRGADPSEWPAELQRREWPIEWSTP